MTLKQVRNLIRKWFKAVVQLVSYRIFTDAEYGLVWGTLQEV